SGKTRHLAQKDFSLEPLGATWKSDSTGALYPIRWQVTVPSLKLAIEVTTPLAQQELAGKTGWFPNYWEGATRFTGTREAAPIRGVGYLEMTGYDRPVPMGQPLAESLSNSSPR
ncbi:MAG TPA: lipocalin family protein, partial [Candidatus Acidoferrales bacterium]